MKKEYISPYSVIFELLEDSRILAMSEIPIGGEIDHVDTHKMDFQDWKEIYNSDK